MAPEGVVNALEAMHAALRSGGALVDIRPAPLHPWVEVERGGEVARLGQIDESFRFETLAMADAALGHVVNAGKFIPEQATAFTFVYHFDCVAAWLAHMERDWHSACLSDDLVKSAWEALPRGVEGEVRIPRVINIARLRQR